ncbi:hypothetical protein SAMN05661096_02162 [Marivirga sericea]|uniref:Outer membrane protein beta-barrel domain-containing protein n=1 Tax=Marivirga sericea TaxID=1028 RepID=A0A1X7JZ01_9BACT|nr:hypothetical protein [Marivirga sericea]SMG33814.1 hypothetical protein SAMN05661096_02162 [Marivirga sericea]
MHTKYLALLAFLLYSFVPFAQEQEQKFPISYYAGTGMGGHDFLMGQHHYVGIDQSVWKFLYASTHMSFIHANNQKYFKTEDLYLDQHSYNLIMQLDANIRIKIGPITLTPHAGISYRYSDEVMYLLGSNQPPETPLEDFKSYRKVGFSGISFGKAVGLNLEFMVFEHTSFGLRTDFQEYNNNPTSLTTLTFQLRTNFTQLIKDLKAPIEH